jgi:DNA-formamidopyrimidine glycosylase
MPELPEVESFRRYLEATSFNKKIEEVDVKSPELLQNIDVNILKENLEGSSFKRAQRHGKYLFVLLDNDSWIVFHFGMTGTFKYFKNSGGKPLYSRIIFNFEDESHLAFNDQRKFGKIYLTSKILDFIKGKKLGPDALTIDIKTFKNLYKKRRGASKSALMNQHIMAGVGNIYSDEILYHAHVHPKTPFHVLNDDKITEIFNIMKKVLNTSVDMQIHGQKFPDSYLIPHRIKNGKCPDSNMKLKTIKIAGRTSYFCPECQKEIISYMKLEKLCEIASTCTECPLHKNRTRVVFGEGPEDAKIMLIGEAPGKNEDEKGKPFVGMAGKLLSEILQEAGIDRSEVFITSIVKCRPEANRKPRKLEYTTCIDLFLKKQIGLINPDIVGLLGNSAIYALIGEKNIKKIHGNTYKLNGRKYMALFHPAAALYSRKLLPQLKEDMMTLKKEIGL